MYGPQVTLVQEHGLISSLFQLDKSSSGFALIASFSWSDVRSSNDKDSTKRGTKCTTTTERDRQVRVRPYWGDDNLLLISQVVIQPHASFQDVQRQSNDTRHITNAVLIQFKTRVLRPLKAFLLNTSCPLNYFYSTESDGLLAI